MRVQPRSDPPFSHRNTARRWSACRPPLPCRGALPSPPRGGQRSLREGFSPGLSRALDSAHRHTTVVPGPFRARRRPPDAGPHPPPRAGVVSLEVMRFVHRRNGSLVFTTGRSCGSVWDQQSPAERPVLVRVRRSVRRSLGTRPHPECSPHLQGRWRASQSKEPCWTPTGDSSCHAKVQHPGARFRPVRGSRPSRCWASRFPRSPSPLHRREARTWRGATIPAHGSVRRLLRFRRPVGLLRSPAPRRGLPAGAVFGLILALTAGSAAPVPGYVLDRAGAWYRGVWGPGETVSVAVVESSLWETPLADLSDFRRMLQEALASGRMFPPRTFAGRSVRPFRKRKRPGPFPSSSGLSGTPTRSTHSFPWARGIRTAS